MIGFTIRLASRAGIAKVCVQGSLSAESLEALHAELTPLRFAKPWLAVADLRGLEMVDDVGATALREELAALPRVALLLPQSWSQAFFKLRPMLAGLPFYQLAESGELAAGTVPMQERRRSPRVAVKMLAALQTVGGQTRNAWTLDLSRGGVRVASRMPPLPEELPVAITIGATTVPVRVVRLESEPHHSWGLEFAGPLGELAPLLDSLG